jgi:hypothetical protein
VPTLTTTATGKNRLVVRWRTVDGAIADLVDVVLTGGARRQFIALATSAQLQPSSALAARRHGADATISIRALSSAGLVGPRDVREHARNSRLPPVASSTAWCSAKVPAVRQRDVGPEGACGR